MKRIGWVVAVLVLANCGGQGNPDPAGTIDAGASAADGSTIGALDAPTGEPRPDVALDHASPEPTTDGPADLANDPPAIDTSGSRAADSSSGDTAAIDGSASDGGAADAAGEGGPPADPLCSTADSRGFFGSCSVCGKPDDCDQITVGGRTRSACGCSTVACPCGLRCGCSDVATGVRICNVCVR